MNIDHLVDVHTHAEVSCRQPSDALWQACEDAASKYFKVGKRPTIAETIAYYRERKIGLVMFTVDSEFQGGNRRIPNQEVADAAAQKADSMTGFVSIDPRSRMRSGHADWRVAPAGWQCEPRIDQEIPRCRLRGRVILRNHSTRRHHPGSVGRNPSSTLPALSYCPGSPAACCTPTCTSRKNRSSGLRL